MGVGIILGRAGEEVTPSPPPVPDLLLDDGGDTLTDDSGNELTNG